MSADDDFFLMANLSPIETGLPMVVWVQERGNACHDVRIKVNGVHGPRMTLEQVAEVAVRPSPRVVAGHLTATDMRAVAAWISLNEAVLVEYWNGSIFTGEMIRRLQRLPTESNPPADLPGEDDDLEIWASVNLFPRTTGLPMVVWIMSNEGVRHDCRVRVARQHGDRGRWADSASITVRPTQQLIGRLGVDDFRLAAEWIRLNQDVILDYWDGRLDDIGDVLKLLKRLP